MSDFSVRTESFSVGSHSWLGSKHGVDEGLGCTLDLDEFTLATHYPDGFIPSGTVLAIVTSSGLYGPYDDGDVPAGVGVAVGHLLNDIYIDSNSSATNLAGAFLNHCRVVEANLPDFSGGAGEIDANGKGDLPLVTYI